MAAPRRDMRDVELVDGDGVRPLDAAGASRRPGVVVALVVAVLAVAVLGVGGGVAGERRETARLAALAAVPGVLSPLDGEPVELWRSPDAPVGDLREVDGRLLGAVRGAGGSVDAVGLDRATGEALWRTPVGAGAAAERWTRCVVPDGGGSHPEPVVACVVVDETATTEQSALGSRTYPTAARLVVVDAASGDVARELPTAATSVVAAVGPDLVLAWVDGAGSARAERADPRTGARRWAFTGPGPVPTDQFRQRAVRVEAAGDLVAVDGGPVWVLSARDGSVVESWQPDPTLDTGGQVRLLAGGTLLARPAADDGGWGTELVDVRSGRRSTAPGYPVPVQADDQSLRGVVLMLSVEGRRVLAVDAATGRTRWSVPAGSGGRPVVVDGRVVRAEGRTLRVRDGRSGEVVWSAPLATSTRSPVVVDGRVVVVSLPGPAGSGALTAYALADGRRAWSVDVDHEVLLTGTRTLLLGWTGTGLVAVGPPVDEAARP